MKVLTGQRTLAKKVCALLLSGVILGLLQGCSDSGSDQQAKAEATDKSLPTQPNIVFILVDDLGWGDVGYNGSTWMETPNIDQLAATGKVFDNAYMYPTCSPSRAALATGKQSFRTQAYTVPVLEKGDNQTDIFSRWTVSAEHLFYSEPLKAAGYQLAHLGKWHLVGPNPEQENDYPFDKPLTQPDNGDTQWHQAHFSGQYRRYYPEGRGYDLNVGGTWWGDPARGYKEGYKSYSGGYHAPFKNPFIEDKPSDEWLTDRLTDDAIAFMDANKGQPFFVNLHYYTVHRPSIARSPELLEKYQQKSKDPVTGQHASRKREAAGYGTLVQNMDENVGRIIQFLESSKLRENTLIVFTSDNGFNRSQSVDDRLRGAKGDIYEGGVKVPALFNWPDKIAPGRVAAPVSVLDYFPTFLDIAGIRQDYQGQLDGDSIWPLALGQGAQEFTDRPIFWHIASTYKHGPVSAIRRGNWKLIQFLNTGKRELYDLSTDQKESHNLVTERPDIAEQLTQQLTEWRRTNGAPLPPASPLEG